MAKAIPAGQDAEVKTEDTQETTPETKEKPKAAPKSKAKVRTELPDGTVREDY
jgi:hypothetical protein